VNGRYVDDNRTACARVFGPSVEAAVAAARAGVKVGGCLNLSHDVLGEAAIDLFGDRRDVAKLEGRGTAWHVVPLVLADVLEEQIEPADPGLLHAGSVRLGREASA
jgi:hypothetical protein